MISDKEIRILEFTKEDAHQCVELMHLTINSCYPVIYPKEVVNYFLDYHNPKDLIKKASKGTLLLLFKDSKLLATGYLFKRELGGVYVHPNYQHKGYGKTLVLELIKIARAKKFDHIWLDATPIALAFYKSIGFAVTQECRQIVTGNVPLDYYRMYKQL